MELTSKHASFRWTQEHQQAFYLVKEALASDTVMAHPRTDPPCLLYFEASNYAVNANSLRQLEAWGRSSVISILGS